MIPYKRLILITATLFCGWQITLNAQDSPTPLTGTINDETPVYEVPVTITDANSTIIADLQPSDPESELDTLLYLVDSDGNILMENDDRVRGDRSSRLVYPAAEPGNYVIIATRYKAQAGKSAG